MCIAIFMAMLRDKMISLAGFCLIHFYHSMLQYQAALPIHRRYEDAKTELTRLARNRDYMNGFWLQLGKPFIIARIYLHRTTDQAPPLLFDHYVKYPHKLWYKTGESIGICRPGWRSQVRVAMDLSGRWVEM